MSDQPAGQGIEGYTPQPRTRKNIIMPVLAFFRKRPDLTLCVILPNILLFIYLTCIASPQYVSEAHFMVRSERSQNGTSLSMLLQVGGESITSENTFAVQDYMTSRDAMNLLIQKEGLAKVFDPKNADFMARYPNWYSRTDHESFYRYYKRHIKAQVDAETSLSVLRVRTFSASDSKRIATALITASEGLINEINDRQRQNLIGAAQKEVTNTLAQLKKLQERMANFRDTNAIIDPEKQTAPLVGTQYALQAMLLSTQMRLDRMRLTSPESPTIKVYEQQISVLQHELKTAGSRLTGGTESLVPKLTEFDTLSIQRQLLEKVLMSEVASLEAAKAQANRQMVFLEEVTKPDQPDYPEYPPVYYVMAISIFCTYGLYVMIKLLVAGAREHKIT
ncbi:capsule biosynthesis protein [Asaia lannensis]|uniref:Capsule biosynthesis protein n=2 Tax=Asaia TaxID=91914 RepID=A0ABT1CFU9_9PROT|nr:capsule biosynthesis protein [Asaia lannensis]MCO6159743.1 capsule biosynthesis protein [Asaia lannensis NBRC 102526]GBQ96357.1 lipopolysaccharide biosynthesis protein [Asaia lannensis NBRC 102526]